MRARRWGALAGVLAVIGLLAAPAVPGLAGGRVLAHAQLVASSPASGSVLPESPAELRLVFSEPLEQQVTSLDLTLAGGDEVLSRAGEVDPEDPFALVVSDPRLPDGVYTLAWRTLSAADGHTAEGFLSFGIGEGATVTAIGGGHVSHTETDPLGVIGRWLTYLGLLAALGLAAFHRLVLRRDVMAPQLRRLIAGALAVTALATVAMALGSGLEAGAPIEYLLDSRNGVLQLARAALAAGGVVALASLPGRYSTVAAAAVGLTGIVLLIAAGHASAIPGPAAIVAGVIHVAAVAVWLGGVAGLLIVLLRPGWLGRGTPPTPRTLVPRFSALALVSIGFVVATGAYAAWVQTGTILPVGTEYGRTLVMKSALAAGAIGLGGLNFLDGGRMRGWLDGFRTRLSVEAMVSAAVLVMSASLAATPPVEDVVGVAIAPIPDAFGEVAPGMSLEVVPGRPGVNRIVVRTNAAMAGVDMDLGLDDLGGGGTTRVPLVLEGLEGMAGMEGMDHGSMITPDADGRVARVADALVLPAGSNWDASVRILTEDGTELSRQRFSFALDDDGISEGEAGSWLSWGTLIAGLLGAGGAIGLGLGLGGAILPRCDVAASRVALVGGGVIGVALGALIGLGQLVV